MFQYPGKHCSGGGLAVCAGYRQHPFLSEHVLGQPLRPGNKRQSAVENFLDQRIAAGHHVANDEDVRLEFDLIGGETFGEGDVLLFKLGAHRRIDIGVTTRDFVSRLFCEHGDAAHEAAADTEDVNVHYY